MTSNLKVLLISHLPLPYHGIGSWTTLYDNYISKSEHQIDAIICPPIKKRKYPNIEYEFFSLSRMGELRNKLISNRFYHFIRALDNYISKYKQHQFIIQVIDNYGLVGFLHDYLKQNDLGNKTYVQFFYHGFLLDKAASVSQDFFSQIDELVLLTKLSYFKHLNNFNVLPRNVSILTNGIDVQKFNSNSIKKKQKETIFLWCSQDRRKKGLHIILEIWSKFRNQFNESELWIVGSNQNYNNFEGIRNFGKVPNKDLPEVYRKADVYLFPTLCQEGFGLTLAEALHCGCFCIASSLGGVPEVLNHGEYGWLIDEPHNPDKWSNAMLKYISDKPANPKIPKSLYSLNSWSLNMNKIISDAKRRLKEKNT